jgi:hypothetical protein
MSAVAAVVEEEAEVRAVVKSVAADAAKKASAAR